jgi:hypothetical protein
MKQLTLETFWVVLLVTSAMAVVDIRGRFTWQEDDDNSWRSYVVTWGALSLVWGAARAVLLYESPTDHDDSPVLLWYSLAPTMATVLVWVILLIASRWDDALQDTEQDWILPDSLLYLGAASTLAAASWAATQS